MLQKIIYIIFILSSLTVSSYGIHVSEYNETQFILSINSKLSELEEKLTNKVAKDSDMQFIRAEIERQKNCVVVKEADNESSRADIQVFKTDIQNITAELEHQKEYILEKEADCQSLKADFQVFRAEIQSLRAELEQQKKYIREMLKDDLDKESDKIRSWFHPHNCAEAKFSGIYDILIPKFSSQSFKVVCEAQTQETGWTIILRRMDGSVNFYRNWAAYKNGFGNLDGEFFLGLDKIHAMTAERPQELLVLLEDFEGEKRFETYDDFAIGDERQKYELHTLGKANGTAGDALSPNRGQKFSTSDKDIYFAGGSCDNRGTGAWWYLDKNYCQMSQLTGTYKDNRQLKGVNWSTFRGLEYSLKRAIMMIRPKK